MSQAWWRIAIELIQRYNNYMKLDHVYIMMTSSNGNICRVTGHLCSEFTGHRWIPCTRPVTRSFDVFFDLRLNKRLSKQSWSWWFETPTRPLWRHCNDSDIHVSVKEYQKVNVALNLATIRASIYSRVITRSPEGSKSRDLVVKIIVSPWYLTDVSAALLSRCQTNVRAIR